MTVSLTWRLPRPEAGDDALVCFLLWRSLYEVGKKEGEGMLVVTVRPWTSDQSACLRRQRHVRPRTPACDHCTVFRTHHAPPPSAIARFSTHHQGVIAAKPFTVRPSDRSLARLLEGPNQQNSHIQKRVDCAVFPNCLPFPTLFCRTWLYAQEHRT